jgi:hypothetical protein
MEVRMGQWLMVLRGDGHVVEVVLRDRCGWRASHACGHRHELAEFPLGVPLLPVDPKYHVSAAKSIRAFLLWEHQIRATEGRFAWMQYLPIPLYHGQRNLPIYVTQIRDNFLHIIAPIKRNSTSGLNTADWAP